MVSSVKVLSIYAVEWRGGVGGGREQVWKCVEREETYVGRSVGRSVGERMSCNNVLPTLHCVGLCG